MENPRSCRFFTSQFQAKKFLLDFEEPSLIGTAQCGRYQPLYIVYRSLWAVFWIAVVIYDVYYDVTHGRRWPIYVSNWAFTMLAVSAVLHLAASIYHIIARPEKKEVQKMSVFYKVVWVFYSFPAVSAIGVTLMFWGFLYEGSINFNGLVAHGINALYVLTDIFITGTPIRILHFFHVLIFMSTYIIFTVVYQLGFDQDAIYPIFDWDKAPGQAVGVAAGLLVASVVIQIVLFFLYWLRVVLCCCAQPKVEDEQNSDIRLDL